MNIDLIIKNASAELKNCGIKTANLDAIVLLEKALGKERSYFISHGDEPMTNAEYSRFRRLIRRRKQGEPVAYILGHKEFYGYDFFVNKNVLIPRPETEFLVEQAIEYLKCHCDESRSLDNSGQDPQSGLPRTQERPRNDRNKSINIIDIGTGSGCIIISVIKEVQKLENGNWKLEIKYHANDIDNKALYVARKNAKFHKVNKKIRFFHSDLFSNQRMPKYYDLIIANLPYVPKDNSKLITQNSKLLSGIYFEPENAIFAKDNGTEIIKIFLNQAKDRINKNGLILIEVDPRNAKELLTYAKNIFDKSKIELLKDLSNIDRVIRILH